MDSSQFAAHLAQFGPHAKHPETFSRERAEAYCRDLAARHYENFTVASWLLPRHLRQPFANVYAYCRWSDDLADETSGGEESLALLSWWEEQLHACYQGNVRHPVLVALAETVRQFQIPPEPFADLLVAFRQDQHQRRYSCHEEVLNYCRYSANPVGRLVLYLGRCHDDHRGRLADSVCTGLQLANFCQDVAGDYRRGRVYLPQDVCRQYGYTEEMFAQSLANEAFGQLISHEVERAEGYLRAGFALVPLVPRELQVDVELFVRGGLAILERIRRVGYDVWNQRPEVPKTQQVVLLLRCWWAKLRRPSS